MLQEKGAGPDFAVEKQETDVLCTLKKWSEWLMIGRLGTLQDKHF
jgi:hypothetical protein